MTLSLPDSRRMPPPANTASKRGALLLNSLRRSWQRGEPLQAEELLRRYPEFHDDPEVVVQLLYEEVCLAREAGQEVSSEDVIARFPGLAGELSAVFGCHALLADTPAALFPEVGERLGEFQLLAELGRGACGRVFLAEHSLLADRPVVLKVTACEGKEHQVLARLQHTHIIPLHFVTEWPERNLRGLCMPDFGGLSLQALLAQVSAVPPALRTGRHLLAALQRARSRPETKKQELRPVAPSRLATSRRRLAPGPETQAPVRPGPVQRFLAHATFAEAMCWVAACLADALQHAHERGLVHLDVKPANVLLAGDGQPMLFDFHLAHGPLPPGAQLDQLGGTPGYMPPEQEAALRAVSEDRPVPAGVDGRADVYALGMVLCETLAEQLPRPFQADGALAALRTNPQVSVGLGDIIRRCLEYEPGRRYDEARQLAEDLRLHLDHKPLRGVPNRSLLERWRKWRRRCRAGL